MSLYQEKRSGPSCIIHSVNVLTPVAQSAILNDKKCDCMLSHHSWKEFMEKPFIKITLRTWLGPGNLSKDINILIICLVISPTPLCVCE